MKTPKMSPLKVGYSRDLSRLALDAAAELDQRVLDPTGSDKSIRELALALRALFPADRDRPLLPPETIGLVCEIMENSFEGEPSNDFTESNRSASRIANKLEEENLSEAEADWLIDVCHALHKATQRRSGMSDIPEDHPFVLTLA
jgi:hypothetical protein